MVILCGGMLKIVSISLHMGTDVVRENFLLVMVAITMAICSMAYEAVVRVAPWMVGRKKVKWESILERTASVVKPELH